MDEAIRIGAEGGVPVEIYHLKAAGQRNWGKTGAMIAKIDSARAAGVDVQANMYPYVAGGTGSAPASPPGPRRTTGSSRTWRTRGPGPDAGRDGVGAHRLGEPLRPGHRRTGS
jgi:hypothetical protein